MERNISSARYRKKFAAEIEPQLVERLKTGSHICGEVSTAADCVVGHNVSWAHAYGLCRDELFSRYLSLLSKRPAFAHAFDD